MRCGIVRGFFFILMACFMMVMSTKDIQAAQLAQHLHKKTLDNGLTLLVKETPGNKAATVQFWVKTGSVYEAADEGGITHLIEHMIFKGTENLGPGKLAEAIESHGGRINAYTSYEYTVYHATLASRYWEKALEVLSDAVLNSTFDPEELEREKKVVLEEIRMRNDRPDTRLFQELMTSAFSTHPYRLPIIGTNESVSGFTRQDIIDYMEKNYNPDNFTVVVVGDVRFAEVLGRVRELLADLPKSGNGRPEMATEPEQVAPHFFKLEEDVNQTHMALALTISRFDSPDTPVLDVIAQILGQGETSRLYNQLRNEKQLVYRISSSAFTPHDPGLFEISAILDADKVEAALGAVLEEVFKLKYMPVNDEELKRAKANLESDFVFNLERVEGQARVLGSFELLAGDPREDDYLEQIRTVSKEDIVRVATQYLQPERLNLGLLVPVGSEVGVGAEWLQQILAQAESMARTGVPSSLVADAYLPNVHRFKLPNGIRLLVREDHEVPTVGIHAVFPGGLRGETLSSNGAFAFVSDLLPKGTKKMNTRELAVAVGDMAGDISGFNGKNTFGLRADFLGRYFEEGLELVRDVLLTPSFDPQEAEKIRGELLAQLRQQEDSLPSLAFREFNRLLFQDHPYGLNTLGAEEAVRGFTTDQLRAIYDRYAVPGELVLAVSGAVDAEMVWEKVRELFGDWQVDPASVGVIQEEDFLPPEPPAVPDFMTIPRDKEQSHIIIGFLGTTLTGDDRFAVEVMETLLGGQSGRLFTELRDKKSLAYSLSSFALLGLDTGSFGIYIGTSPEKREQAIQGVWQELQRLSEELPADEELQRAKNVLIGQYELGLQTHGTQSLEMALNEIYGLGQDFGNRYVEQISQVGTEQVREAARKYIQADHYVLVTVGAADSQPASSEAVKEGDVE